MKHRKQFKLNESKSCDFFYKFFSFLCSIVIVINLKSLLFSDRNTLQKNIEQITQELQDVKDICEELRGAKQVN